MLETAGAASYLGDLELLALLVAAMAHDLGHDGLTNAFHKQVSSRLVLAFFNID